MSKTRKSQKLRKTTKPTKTAELKKTAEPPKEKQTFQERELEILREAVDKIEDNEKKNIAQSPIISKIIEILEDFLRKKKLICYGGTALNNILPKEDQFYDKNTEIPDYDFYSSNALEDAKELADIYYKLGYDDVEAKAGMHVGTFKVQVHFIPIADITHMETQLFNAIKKDAININDILYAPANLLRLNIYKELSRPKGQVERWEKVFKRMLLLDKHYPIKKKKCDSVQFMRDFEGSPELADTLYTEVKKSMIKQGLVFFGGYACSLYEKYIPTTSQHKINNVPDFDAIAENPEEAAKNIKKDLEKKGIKNIKIQQKKGSGEILAPHYELKVDNNIVCFLYEPLGCHSYNTITINKEKVKIATIDTMINLLLAFTYVNRPYYDKDRILCMAQYIFYVQSKNRLHQRELLKRFSDTCIGTETTLQSIRENRAEKFISLKSKRGTKEYDEYFLKYAPGEKTKKNKVLAAAANASSSASSTKKNKISYKKNKTEKKKWFNIF